MSDDGRLKISFDDVPDDPPREAAGDDDIEVALRPRGSAPRSQPSLRPGAVAVAAGIGEVPAPAAPAFDVAGERQEFASWSIRVGAALIDGLIVTAGALVLLIILTTLGTAIGSSVGGAIVFFFALLFVWPLAQMAYAPTLMARAMPFNGQTVGKQMLGLRVRRVDGQAVSFWFGVLRNVVVAGLLFGWLGSFLFWIPLILDLLWPLWDDENRCLHDIIVKTVVTREA